MNKARNKDRLTSPIVRNRIKWMSLEVSKYMRIHYKVMMEETYEKYIYYLENNPSSNISIEFNNGNRIR